jgi:hypothetical protein
MTENIPDRTSNAGPAAKKPNYDWRDRLDFAGDQIRKAANSEAVPSLSPKTRNGQRIRHIENAIAELEAAKELLCR